MYREARNELNETVKAYFESFRKRDEEMKALIGTIQNGKEWTEQDYLQWRLNQIGRGERFDDLAVKVAERYTKANEVAISYVNDATPSVYSLNRNYAAYTIEKVSGNIGFTLWDESTVKRLIAEEPDLMPYYPKARAVKRGIDLKWGKQQITKAVTQGILQGKSVGKIAKDLQARVSEMNRTSAVRAARTAVTGAQNAGRQDAYEKAVQMGIEMQKEWVATLDGRTRHSHRRIDGEVVDYDKEFSNGCRYPGDPRGKPAEVYNCRCTMVANVKGIGLDDAQRRARNPQTGRNELISNMSYSQWAGWKSSEGTRTPARTTSKKTPASTLKKVENAVTNETRMEEKAQSSTTRTRSTVQRELDRLQQQLEESKRETERERQTLIETYMSKQGLSREDAELRADDFIADVRKRIRSNKK